MLRYLQQTAVNEIGVYGQHLITEAKVLVVGAGGLGVPVATYLAAMGIGEIGIADFDIVQETNLHRQFAYVPEDIGRYKAEVLSDRLRAQNPTIKVTSHTIRLSTENAAEIIANYDLVCDCTDTVEARLLLDRMCYDGNKKLVYAAVKGWEGYVAILHGKAKIKLTDIFSEAELLYESQNTCSIAGVVSTVCGIIGSQQASEAIKIILDIESNLDGSIFCYDGKSNGIKILRLHKHDI
ncbi:HesA/MoeB/ThiF family protein [Flavobacterium sp.]|uniref:HesA/MoeB/ThiF family protein n=1 Tax=Flavobacterium sp. TaxID=239 RepID=UPI00260A1E5E|nr:HesA/MoeB/ThiF family protein [Flavobacterium sp.]